MLNDKTTSIPFAALPALVLAVVLCAGCSNEETESSKDGGAEVVLAEVAGEVITPADLVAESERRIANRQPVPSKEILLEQMVERRALLHQARKAQLHEEPEVKRALENLLIGKFKERSMRHDQRDAKVDEERLRRDYQERIDEFTQPAKFRLAVLYLEASEKATEAKRSQVRARLEEARRLAFANPAQGGRGAAAGGFGELAVRYSDDQVGRYRGGDAGWIEEGNSHSRWPAEVLVSGAKLEVGMVSDIIEAEGGFYLVKKTDERASTTTPFAQVKLILQQQALVQEKEDLERAFREETLSRAGVRIHSEALTGVNLPTDPSALAGDPENQTPPALPGARN